MSYLHARLAARRHAGQAKAGITMRRLQLNRVFGAIEEMTWSQRRLLMGGLKAAQAQDEVRAILDDRLHAIRMCPHCHGHHVVRNGTARGLQRYKCRDGGRTFNALTDTPLARLRYRHRWLDQTQALLDGLSSMSVEHDIVLVVRDRSGACTDQIVLALDTAHLAALLKPVLAPDAVLCTDGSHALAAAARYLGVEHHAINASAGQHALGAWHVKNVNGCHSRLKNWLRRFNGVASSYVHHYLGWLRALERLGPAVLTHSALLALAIGI